VPARELLLALIDGDMLIRSPGRTLAGDNCLVLAVDVEARIRDLGSIDLLVGIPSYNCAHTINYVIKQTAKGLKEFFPDKKSLIVVSDGGSMDGTREVANAFKIPPWIEKIVAAYVGVPGKGTAIFQVFEIGERLGAEGIVMVDSDLRSVVPEWIRLLLQPVLEGKGLVTPLYARHKYDGFITNNVVYPFTRALYGKRIRQPIGGDFGMSSAFVEALLENSLAANPYVSRFGIDVFITHSALGLGFKVAEAFLGVKIHEAKDPAAHLAPMFRQVVGSMFGCMMEYEEKWRLIRGSEPVPLVKGDFAFPKPEPVPVDYQASLRMFKEGLKRYRPLYKAILPSDLYEKLLELPIETEKFAFPVELWAKISYVFSAAFKREGNKENREKLLDAFRICWIGRVGSFILETLEMTDDEAEEKIKKDSIVFEEMKPYLLKIY